MHGKEGQEEEERRNSKGQGWMRIEISYKIQTYTIFILDSLPGIPYRTRRTH